jgi:hypothetical protein
MIVIAAFLAGALSGALIARRRNGRLADILHHAAIYGIASGLLGLFATLIIDRMF